MNLLIVFTHPNQKSLNGAFLKKVVNGSQENSSIKDIQVLNLYEEKFNPILLFNETIKRRHLYKSPNFSKYRDQLLWADKIVFIYPIWWGRPPAMLLGYFDQVFSANFAYKDTGRYTAKGLLKGKSVICISTMKGPRIYQALFLQNVHRNLMKKAVFRFVGMKKVKFFEFGSMEARGQAKNLDKIYRYFRDLNG
ncbi:NAD(P)H-dependent oxidoreductase [Niallia sp. JL1B1071]|uniref:NAD(P)H-dependent oxidoreductase n=1 Tax=Niallia tiangongensis TaxID=3237105 RepID=UPI0037DDC41D